MPGGTAFRAGLLVLSAQFPGQSHREVLDGAVAAAVATEHAGFDDVWFAEDHFMSYGLCPSAATLAAYVLGRTSQITVGTAVSVLSTWPAPGRVGRTGRAAGPGIRRPVLARRRARRPVGRPGGVRRRAGAV